MTSTKLFRSFALTGFAAAALLAGGVAVSAQMAAPSTVAVGNNVDCAGYVQRAPINTTNRLVGGQEEQEQFSYAQNNIVYINAGANRGVQPGMQYSVVRPRGQVNTPWTTKGSLGFYVQEVGMVEVIRVKREVSVAIVRVSCDTLLLGDVLQPWQERVAPVHGPRPAFDLFADPSGKAVGRLFMARDMQEMITRDQIVYVDLGREDRANIGDYLTIFRPLGDGNLMSLPPESVAARSSGYESRVYRGGRFSNQAARKKGDEARGTVQTTHDAKRDRPAGLRKVVGEGVILNVRERTATVLITRTAQEIHTGDFVEIQ
ncbi:MAG: hypothetical protein H0V76_03190 [Blastocatellia bacterium]|nr:hypothetical protein [Blastocatellia bacterium]